MNKFFSACCYSLGLITILNAEQEANNQKTPAFTIFSDFIYWHTTELIQWGVTAKGDINAQVVNYQVVSFDWDPGYRIGLDFYPTHKSDLKFYYTHFYADSTNTAKVSEGQYLTPAYLGNYIVSDSPNFLEGKIVTNIALNMFDSDFDYRITSSGWVDIRPVIGLKGGWISQTFNTDWYNPIESVSAVENLTNFFWGLGPKFGVNGSIDLVTSGNIAYKFLTNLNFAFLYGHWQLTDRYSNSKDQLALIKVQSRNFGEVMLNGFLGFGLNSKLFDGAFELGLKLGYELQDWFNMYQVFDTQTGTNQSDLFLQGLTLELDLTF
jgi:hypothetical protein